MADPREITPTGQRFGSRMRTLMDGLGSAETGRAITVDGLYRLIENEPGLSMSRGHLYRLVEGRAVPRLDLIEALARFFKVPASYFVDDHAYDEETIELVEATASEIEVMNARLAELRVALVRALADSADSNDDNGDDNDRGTERSAASSA